MTYIFFLWSSFRRLISINPMLPFGHHTSFQGFNPTSERWLISQIQITGSPIRPCRKRLILTTGNKTRTNRQRAYATFPFVTMSCEFCKDGKCSQKETATSAADAFGIEDPSQLVDPVSNSSVGMENPPIERSSSACYDDAKGACCRMTDHVLDALTS